MSEPAEEKSPLIRFAIDYCTANDIPYERNGSFLEARKKDSSLTAIFTNHGTVGFLGTYIHDAPLETLKRILDNLL